MFKGVIQQAREITRSACIIRSPSPLRSPIVSLHEEEGEEEEQKSSTISIETLSSKSEDEENVGSQKPQDDFKIPPTTILGV